MEISIILSMATFALVASISPGPVNLVCLNCGSNYPILSGLRFVTGATFGFIALFLTVGMGLYSVLLKHPEVGLVLNITGAVFLLYLSIQLYRFDGNFNERTSENSPTGITGALMQWLNPKAWLASAAGIGAYTDGNNLNSILVFALIYLPICWFSLASWVYSGAYLRDYVSNPRIMSAINKTLAVLLGASCLLLFSDYFP